MGVLSFSFQKWLTVFWLGWGELEQWLTTMLRYLPLCDFFKSRSQVCREILKKEFNLFVFLPSLLIHKCMCACMSCIQCLGVCVSELWNAVSVCPGHICRMIYSPVKVVSLSLISTAIHRITKIQYLNCWDIPWHTAFLQYSNRRGNREGRRSKECGDRWNHYRLT